MLPWHKALKKRGQEKKGTGYFFPKKKGTAEKGDRLLFS